MTTIELKSANLHPRKMAREPKVSSAEQGGTTTAVPIKRESKADFVLGLLHRSEPPRNCAILHRRHALRRECATL
jgi:hypothetical protein